MQGRWSGFLFAFVLTASPGSQTFLIGVAGLVTQVRNHVDEMTAAGTISALVPVVLLVRRDVVTALTFGVIREKG